MNWDAISGKWKQLKGNVREQWGKLTHDRLGVIAGKRQTLSGEIQESYGMTMEEAEKRVKAFAERHKDHRSSATV